MTKSGTFTVKGTFYYAAKAAMESGALTVGAPVSIECDEGNPHDANAVAVCLAATRQKLGHISRQHCARIGKLIRAGKIRSARVAKVKDASPMVLEISIQYKSSDADSRQQATPLPAPIDLISTTAKALPARPGVYKITNKATGRIYVGSSGSVRDRAHKHVAALRSGAHSSSLLQSDFRMYGADCFSFSLVAEAQTARDALLCEAECIEDVWAGGKTLFYNATTDGRGIQGAESRDDRNTCDRRPVNRDELAAKPRFAGAKLAHNTAPSDNRAPAGLPTAGSWTSLPETLQARNSGKLTASHKVALLVLILLIAGVVFLR